MTEDLLALTRRLVRTPSAGDEAAAGRALAGWLRAETDAHVRIDDAGNVVARRTAAAPGAGSDDGDPSLTTGPTLALVGHHDVVAPADDQVAARDAGGTPTEYTVERRDGRLYGRGTADMKGPLAAMAVAFRDADLPESAGGGSPGSDDGGGDSEPGSLVLASFAGEEAGGIGAQHAVDRGFAPTYAVVGEGSTGYSAPGITDVAVAHRGRRGSRVVARGEAAHAGEPEAGDNAIYRAADAVRAIRELATPSATVLGHELEGTVSVTEIEGGSGHNVVPERCALTIDERTVPDGSVDLEAVVAGDPALSHSIESDVPPMACSDAGFADAVLAVARDVATDDDGAADAGVVASRAKDADAVDAGAEDAGGAASGAPQHVVKPHATDAAWLASAGTACVICGAAEPGEAHTADESVSIEVLRRCEEIYRRAVPRVLGD